METNELEKIGLTGNQSKVYIALLKLGEASALQVTRESGLHKSRVYDALERLQEEGLVVSVVRDYKRYFTAVSPDKLLNFVDEKKEIVRKILPELKQMNGMKKESLDGELYKGKEGLKTIHSLMLKEGKDIYVLGAKGLIYTELEYFTPNFERERIKKGMKWKLLWDDEKAKERAGKMNLMMGKVLPNGFSSEGVVNIFGDKVAVVLWKEKYPSAFLINNAGIANAFRKWFELIWVTC